VLPRCGLQLALVGDRNQVRSAGLLEPGFVVRRPRMSCAAVNGARSPACLRRHRAGIAEGAIGGVVGDGTAIDAPAARSLLPARL